MDASAAVRAVLGAAEAPRVLRKLRRARVAVPGLYHGEVANALAKYVGAGTLGADLAQWAYIRASNLAERWVPDSELAREALAEAIDRRHSAYDLLYAVLARRERCAVLTFDRRLIALVQSMKIPAA